ncbi:hypothetical protein VCUG_02433 [Vavraia culicis subsp. floridensis]|uniref:Uncharacterized protein n=1 Tax=Vavraia culicis (isolate floridensis) TaxID=948595 RepID=L2GQZ3_VAVCU|nr:uncharacterized protein VCUG_02433 [Vavraia culicis subsp. floridensis]ELA46071.1 hypothetical protein VCUG_02433 [Vavraia culicis subsp. floridensis]
MNYCKNEKLSVKTAFYKHMFSELCSTRGQFVFLRYLLLMPTLNSVLTEHSHCLKGVLSVNRVGSDPPTIVLPVHHCERIYGVLLDEVTGNNVLLPLPNALTLLHI